MPISQRQDLGVHIVHANKMDCFKTVLNYGKSVWQLTNSPHPTFSYTVWMENAYGEGAMERETGTCSMKSFSSHELMTYIVPGTVPVAY